MAENDQEVLFEFLSAETRESEALGLGLWDCCANCLNRGSADGICSVSGFKVDSTESCYEIRYKNDIRGMLAESGFPDIGINEFEQ